MKFLLLLSILSGLALAIPAPLLEPRAGGGPLIAGRYIVRIDISKFDDIVKGAQGILKKAFRHLYNFGDFAGFTVDMDDALLNKIRNLPGVRCFVGYILQADPLTQHRLNTLSRIPLLMLL
jgi:hypothetical protein